MSLKPTVLLLNTVAWRSPGAARHCRTTQVMAIRQRSKTYGVRQAPKPTQWTIETDELVAIVGRSGCGKSTLQQLGLRDRSAECPARLSAGQRRWVLSARALVHNPRLLLLNVPLSAPDALICIEMHQLIKDLCRHHHPVGRSAWAGGWQCVRRPRQVHRGVHRQAVTSLKDGALGQPNCRLFRQLQNQ